MNNDTMTLGDYTYAFIDGPDDVWFWAIVKDYEESQSYGDIICAFTENYEPDRYVVYLMLYAITK